MARTKGTFSLSANIEPRAAAPLDAREKVALISDLTTANTFPYPYEGMKVYCEENKKLYILTGSDPTVAANWNEAGSGDNVFYGTHDEWELLTPAEKKAYDYAAFNDDVGGTSAADYYQTRTLSEPITVSGIPQTTVEGTLNALATDVYSTSEIKTNKVWINGKPIYRQVLYPLEDINIGSGWSSSSSLQGNIDIEVITSIVVIGEKDNKHTSLIPAWELAKSSDYMGIRIYNTDITKIYATDEVVIEYTKTTD